MKLTLVFLALVAVSQAGVSTSKIFGGRIVNGSDAKPGEIPYQVSLQQLDGFLICGGAILDENYVITAAHCVKEVNANEVQIVSGSVNLDEPKSVHRVVKIITHVEYNPNDSHRNDIALVKVDVPFVVSATVHFVKLPRQGQDFPADAVAVVSGWGRLQEGDQLPTILQRTDILIAAQDYCVRVYNRVGLPIYRSHICAHHPTIETGACFGDSGGPLTVNGTLVGLVSWAYGCAKLIYPTIYTRLSEYIDWIDINAV